jgi:hypothetical protein
MIAASCKFALGLTSLRLCLGALSVTGARAAFAEAPPGPGVFCDADPFALEDPLLPGGMRSAPLDGAAAVSCVCLLPPANSGAFLLPRSVPDPLGCGLDDVEVEAHGGPLGPPIAFRMVRLT